VIERLGYRGIIVIGDDDMLHYAAHLSQQGVPLVAIPKTIHNNVLGTDYTLGFSTGLARGVAFIHELRALAGSREQIIVVETFAAASGYSTLLMAFLSGADRVIIPEVEYDPEILASLILQDKRENPANYAVGLVCNGSKPIQEKSDKYSDLISNMQNSSGGQILMQLLSRITLEETFYQPLTYLLRTGPPDGQDLLGATNFAVIAASLLDQGKFGRMAASIKGELWSDVDLMLAADGVKTVDVDAWYNQDLYTPKPTLIWSVENG
jgi:6-phosphofructokinase 1